MNYIPVVAWGLCPGGTDTEIANYFGSWGLSGSLPSGSGAVACVAHPVHPRIPTIASFVRGFFLLFCGG